jgi:hypothetical protein
MTQKLLIASILGAALAANAYAGRIDANQTVNIALAAGSPAANGDAATAGAYSSGNSGQMDGNVIAASFSGQIELHKSGFEGALPTATPEPMSLFLIGTGLVGIGMIGRRRRRSAN